MTDLILNHPTTKKLITACMENEPIVSTTINLRNLIENHYVYHRVPIESSTKIYHCVSHKLIVITSLTYNKLIRCLI